MKTTCAQCSAQFEITGADLEFYDKVSPEFNGKKYQIPPPTLCPDCRLQRRLLFRNDKHFYKRTCAKTGKRIITIYAPESPFVVYDKQEWWSDNWSAYDYAKEIDFSRPFLEQLQELRLQVPRAPLFTNNIENSDFTNHALNTKNSFLIWGGGNIEDCMYGNYIAFCKDVYDGLAIYSSERCYEGVASEKCYGCLYFYNSRDCTDCVMIDECSSCSYCIGCFGLHQKMYCIFNKQYTKSEWEAKRAELGDLTHEVINLLQTKLSQLRNTNPHRSSHIFASEDCSGDGIYNSKNCYHSFDIKDCEDCKYIACIPNSKDCYDCSYAAPDGLELSYESNSTLGGQQLLFNFLVYYCNNTYYSFECHHSTNLFGCVGIKHGEYCILNKQYSKEEYHTLVIQIIEHMRQTGEWGEYFTLDMAPYAYNETVAHDYFPLSKKQAISQGIEWRDELDSKNLSDIPTIHSSLKEEDEHICSKVYTCEVSGKQFKVTPKELLFYRSMGIELPRRHPLTRHRNRLDFRGKRRLFSRTCDKCSKEMQTTYSPERPEKVYCEACYLGEVY